MVDHLEQHVGRVGGVGEIAELVDDEHARLHVGGERLAQLPGPRGDRELLDEVVRLAEERRRPVLDGAVGDGDAEVRLPEPGRPAEDDAAPVVEELGA